ncbi:hypothetical protein OVA24_04665 [Luteolibacter sp. SL250]|uniref:hypothetical protein n=1 Tax=Luteolibacter sp. SL250 TaxID=2995170 RepID=UPI00226E34F3|nr:hypothetical protein [Luteolibacter sp. SL250]WAC20671.1 hypothetical protein OVA24_04665 [Luteolibacter sp. SL250]
MSKEEPLVCLRKLIGKGELSHAAIQGSLGVTLQVQAERSNPSFNSFGADDLPSWLAKLDYRAATANERKSEGLLILDLKMNAGVAKQTVIKEFGKPALLVPPTPRQPPDSPIYEVYRFEWGKCSFGYARSAPDVLQTVVLDTIREKK